MRRQTTMGFAATKPLGEHEFEAMRDRLLEEAKKVFKPEFINRLDDIIVFHQLTKADLMQIVELEVAKVLRAGKGKRSAHRARAIGQGIPDRERVTIRSTGRVRCAGRWNVIWKIRSRRNCCAEM